MAKRSREDFEPSSPVSGSRGYSIASTPLSSAEETQEQVSSSKILQPDTTSGLDPTTVEMRCSLPPHRQTLLFSSYEEYEVHYNKTHVNRCIECRKNFPTEHFLNLHIEENHDALISVKRERGEKTYSCFVEDCDKKCSTPQKRRLHLVDKHLFPKDYDFYIINDGIDYRSSLLKSGRQRMRNSAAQQMTDADDKRQGRSSTLESTTEDDSHDIEGLTGAMSALKFVPPSVRFGRGRGGGRGGFSKS